MLKDSTNFLLLLDQNWEKQFPRLQKKLHDFLTSHNEKMQFEELNVNEFEEAYERLKQNKAEGFDDLNSNIIIDAYDV